MSDADKATDWLKINVTALFLDFMIAPSEGRKADHCGGKKCKSFFPEIKTDSEGGRPSSSVGCLCVVGC